MKKTDLINKEIETNYTDNMKRKCSVCGKELVQDEKVLMQNVRLEAKSFFNKWIYTHISCI